MTEEIFQERIDKEQKNAKKRGWRNWFKRKSAFPRRIPIPAKYNACIIEGQPCNPYIHTLAHSNNTLFSSRSI